MKSSLLKKNLIAIFSLTLVCLMIASIISAVSASTINNYFDGKGAIAQWSIGGPGGPHTINAIVDMSNSGKDGEIYLIIVHPLKGTSEAAGSVNFKWSMDHVTVETTLTFSGAPGRTGPHNITISWQTEGPTSNEQLTANTANGLTASINGAWKLGVAELSILDSSGHHDGDDYTSSWAIIVHGTADITLTTP